MPFTIVSEAVQHSSAHFVGIRCKLCGNTSYSSQDVEARYCPWCQIHHQAQATSVTRPTSEVTGESKVPEYRLCRTSAKHGHKTHWTVSGEKTLCNQKVFTVVKVDYDGHLPVLCANCMNLKERGFVR